MSVYVHVPELTVAEAVSFTPPELVQVMVVDVLATMSKVPLLPELLNPPMVAPPVFVAPAKPLLAPARQGLVKV